MTTKEIKTVEKEIKEYFLDYKIKITDKFNLKKCAHCIGLSLDITHILLCNLENTEVMTEIANGNFDNFNWDDGDLFNDCYEDMMEDLGFVGNDEEE